MKVSLTWLRDYVAIDLSPDELASRLTMTGTKVEAIERIGAEWDKILVGRIAHLEPHPDPEVSLQLATVDLGNQGEQRVVTGAFNIAVGDKVPYAGVGVTLPNGLTLKSRSLRGVVSNGMVLADDELGLGEDHTGIRILDPESPSGASLIDVLGDAILDLEITTNRPDCLSVAGIAREIAAITGKTLHLPPHSVSESGPATTDILKVDVEEPTLCRRFTARAVTGVSVGPSQDWLVQRLQASGIRSVNNVVDITNYVMLELGQPMHAYDLDKLDGQSLRVRRGHSGEILETLDGQTRTVTEEQLVIADGANNAIGLAGLMGGASTEVSTTTSRVALEVASWDPATIRRAATTLGVRTEASSRYEKGLPTYLTALAADRASALMVELAGATVCRGTIDVVAEQPVPPAPIALPLAEPRRLLGVDIGMDTVVNTLAPLGFNVSPASDGGSETASAQGVVAVVDVPPWRQDVKEQADLVEEIARMMGYESFPETLLQSSVPGVERDVFRWRRLLRSFLLGCGLSEANSHPLIGDGALQRLRDPAVEAAELEQGPLSEDEISALVPNAAAVVEARATYGPGRLENPMTPERSVLRPTMMPGLLEAASGNLRAGESAVQFFELGKTYFPRVFHEPNYDIDPAFERQTLGIVLAGLSNKPSWGVSPRPVDFFDLKGILEEFLFVCGIRDFVVEAGAHPVLHPGRAARIFLSDRRGHRGEELVVFGEVHPIVAQRFDVDDAMMVAEVDLETVLKHAEGQRTYREVSKYPSVRRDLSVVVDQNVDAGAVLRGARQGAGKLMRDISLLDIYQGEPLASGEKSLTVSFVFQSPEGTLTDRTVDGIMDNIRRRLHDTVSATFRG